MLEKFLFRARVSLVTFTVLVHTVDGHYGARCSLMAILPTSTIWCRCFQVSIKTSNVINVLCLSGWKVDSLVIQSTIDGDIFYSAGLLKWAGTNLAQWKFYVGIISGSELLDSLWIHVSFYNTVSGETCNVKLDVLDKKAPKKCLKYVFSCWHMS